MADDLHLARASLTTVACWHRILYSESAAARWRINLIDVLREAIGKRATGHQRLGLNMKNSFLTVVVLAILATNAEAQGRIVTEMTAVLIDEAIKAGEKGDVPSGQMTQSSGVSWGSIHIATFSTPYMRVAAAARQAKKEYKRLNPADVTPEMIAPELHVYAWPQGLSENGPAAANVTAVVITPKKGNDEQKAANVR